MSVSESDPTQRTGQGRPRQGFDIDPVEEPHPFLKIANKRGHLASMLAYVDEQEFRQNEGYDDEHISRDSAQLDANESKAPSPYAATDPAGDVTPDPTIDSKPAQAAGKKRSRVVKAVDDPSVLLNDFKRFRKAAETVVEKADMFEAAFKNIKRLEADARRAQDKCIELDGEVMHFAEQTKTLHNENGEKEKQIKRLGRELEKAGKDLAEDAEEVRSLQNECERQRKAMAQMTVDHDQRIAKLEKKAALADEVKALMDRGS